MMGRPDTSGSRIARPVYRTGWARAFSDGSRSGLLARSAASVAVALGVSGCGGYFYDNGSWTSAEHIETSGTRKVAVATAYSIQTNSVDADHAHVDEAQLCREAEVGLRKKTRERIDTKDKSIYMPAVLLSLLGGGGVALATQTDGDKYTTGQTALYAGGAGLIGLGLFMGVMTAALPSERRASQETGASPFVRWNGAPSRCPGTPITPVANAHVDFTASFPNGPDKYSWALKGDAEGDVELPRSVARARRVAAWCGPTTLVISSGRLIEVAADPDAVRPTRGARGSINLAIGLPSERPTLAALALEDPEAAQVASRCCAANVARNTEDTAQQCEGLCLEAGGATKCLHGSRACALAVRQSEFKEEAEEQCKLLFDQCLMAAGTSRENLARCRRDSAEQQTREACR